MKRRGFLGALAAAPFAGRTVAEQIAKQSNISAGGLVRGKSELTHVIWGGGDPAPKKEMWGEAFRLFPELRAERESLFFEQEAVSSIDPDIAVYRSFSLNAKIAYQRQRNVAQKMKDIQSDTEYERKQSIAKRVLAFFEPKNGRKDHQS